MKRNPKVLLMFVLLCMVFCSGGVNLYAEASGIMPELAFNKVEYSAGEDVKMSLKLSGIRPGDKTNSVTFEVEYDQSAFALAGGSPDKDITDGYIKFTTKNDIEKNGTKQIRVMYVDPSTDAVLKDGIPVFTVQFKVKSNASQGDKTFTLRPVNMLDSSFSMHPVNGGGSYTKTVKITTGGKGGSQTVSFTDTTGHWAEKYIETMADKGITQGLDKEHFNPEGVVTRAQFAGFLVRSLGVKQVEYEGNFTDITSHAWYADLVATAVKAGIVKGAGDAAFLPEGLITREEMSVMILRAYEYATGKKAADAAQGYTPKFTDMDSVSSWAQESVKAANTLGIINGMTDTTFVPAEKATRAQAAKMIIKFLEVSGL